jgi:hypothetical protein
MQQKTFITSTICLIALAFLLNAFTEDEKKASGQKTATVSMLPEPPQHWITIDEGAVMVKRYINFKDAIVVKEKNGQKISLPNYLTFDIEELKALINDKKNKGLRIYFAINEKNKLTAVLTGVKPEGGDYYLAPISQGGRPGVLDDAQTCDSGACRVGLPDLLLNFRR